MSGVLVPGKKRRLVRGMVPPEPPPAAAPEQEGDEDRLSELRRQKEECSQACAKITNELTLLEDAEKRSEIESIALSPDKKLFDLLVERVLDPSPDWRTKIDTLINIPNSLSGANILRGGSYFEALFQLMFAVGELPQFRGPKKFKDIDEYNKIKDNKYPQPTSFIHTKVVKNAGGSETGIADIVFELGVGKGGQTTDYECGKKPPEPLVTDNPHYFISVKGYRKEKSLAHGYDISNLFHQISIFPEIKNRNIIVCVRNKEAFLTKMARTQQEFLKNSISHVIGYDEVMDAFEAYRIRFFLSLPPSPSNEAIRNRATELFPRSDQPPKPMLSLYFHQELVVKAVVARIQSQSTNTEPHFMCIGVLPRGGKSFIAGGIIDDLRKKKGVEKPFNVLFLTSAVNETREQFQQDLIDKFAEFQSFDFVDPVKRTGGTRPNKFVFVSRQLAGKKMDVEEEAEESIVVTDIVKLLTEKMGGMPEFDVCFFDEAHIGINSATVRSNFSKAFAQFKMPILLMTATYSKPALVLKSDEDLFIWDLQDIKDMKTLPAIGYDAFLAKKPDVLLRYPGIGEETLTRRRTLGETEERLAIDYVNFPTPNFISLTFAPDTIKHLRDTGVGYDYTKAFQIRAGASSFLKDADHETWAGLLTHEEDARRIRQFLTPETEPDIEEAGFLQDKDRKYRALNQIFRIAKNTNSRPFADVPFSMLMFLPVGPATPPIGELCRIWASFMRRSPYWRDRFVFLTLSTYTNKKYKPESISPEEAVKRGICHREQFKTGLKDTIRNVERAALEENKGLVLLSGDVAKMGISLKCVDIVCLMSTNKDADDIIQKMYRALTGDPPQKKDGFIIDLNMTRIVTAMFDYAVEKAKRSPASEAPREDTTAIVSSVFELCNWGQDAFIEDEAALGKTFNDIYNDIKVRVIDDLSRRISLRKAEGVAKKQVELIAMNSDLNQEMMRVLKGTSGKKGKPKATELAARNEELLPPGASNAAAVPETEGEEPPEPAVTSKVDTGLTDEQIRKKMGDILVTFVNALVIRSSEKWDSGTTFAKLFAKYLEDKSSATGICDCSAETTCKTPHTNIYDTAFCELKPYATTSAGMYDDKIHAAIMKLVEGVFSTQSALTLEWDTYTDLLIRELVDRTPRGGARHQTTMKKHSDKVRHGRRTLRKRVGYY